MRRIATAVRYVVEDRVGDTLLGIAYFEGTDATILYMRDDVREAYERGETDCDEMLNNAIRETVTDSAIEGICGAKIDATVTILEDEVITLFRVPTSCGIVDQPGGIYLRFERDEDLDIGLANTIREIIEREAESEPIVLE